MPEFRMPSLGADMEVGTVLEWLVQPGAVVHRGDIVAVVDTAKAAVEVEVFDDGVVDEILVPVGQSVPVGTPLALLQPIGASVPGPRPAAETATPPRETASPGGGQVPVASPIVRHLAHQRGVDLAALQGTGVDGAVTRDDVELAVVPPRPAQARPAAARPAAPDGRVRSSPYARRRAAELGVDVTLLTGTGHGGSVTVADVERAAASPAETSQAPEAPAEPAPAVAPDRAGAMRDAIGRLMARSKREIPHYYLTTTVDLGRATSFLRETNRARPVPDRILPAAVLLKAVALGCRDVPAVNGFWQDDRFEAADSVHLGVAIALRGGGLVTPALHDADLLALDALMARLRDLVTRTRAGRLRRAELTDGTLTVTNLGDLGVESVHGVIYPPQVALVGFGKVLDRPVAVDGLLGVRPTVTMTLAADHRVSDGIVGARFLTTVDRLLQQPEALLQGGHDER